ncbi:MAG: hypothetical protein KJO50_04135, partial [Bacteroidia bacterium]|nr:hypothetical protein [Bacteroidia bacterium]
EYTKSLYQVREIGQFLKIVDRTIELIIIENIENYSGDNLYEELLYMKASALYYQLKHKQAEYVLKELIKIQGASKKTRSLFLKNAVEALRYNDQFIRSMIILLIILSGITIGLELLLVRSFYPEHTGWIEKLRITFLLSGILLFIFQEFRVRFVSAIRYKRILNKSKG